MGLAGQYIPILHFFFFQSPMHIHTHFPFQQFGLAGTAHTSFAGIGQVGTLLKGGIQHRAIAVEGKIEFKAAAIQFYGDMTGRTFCSYLSSRRL